MSISSTRQEVFQFLQEPANLVTAYDVNEWLPQFEAHVFDTFWSCVRDQLVERVAVLGADTTWRVSMSPSVLVPYSHLSIVPRWATDDEARTLAGFAAESLGGDPDRCSFGIHGDRTKAEALARSLSQDRFRTNKTWIGWKDLSTLGLPDFRRNKENVMRLNEDNNTADSPVAQAVARHLSGLFENYREQVSLLNRPPKPLPSM